MRRALKHIIPIVMLAVLVQILAPIAMIRVAVAAFDPLNSAPICSAHVDSGENSSSEDNSSGKSLPSHATCCPLCAVGQPLVIPPADPAASIVPPWSWRTFAFIAADQTRLTQLLRGSAQARAPPALS
jgi:hypothetical protein